MIHVLAGISDGEKLAPAGANMRTQSGIETDRRLVTPRVSLRTDVRRLLQDLLGCFPDKTTSLQNHNKNPIRGDYDTYAPTYVWARWAVPWVVEPLARSAAVLSRGARVLEIGCGTGNYIWALLDVFQELNYVGFDVSAPMLDQARSRGPAITFVHGDAATRFPFPDQSFALAFAVDVIHHVDALSRFFDEAHRVLVPSGKLIIVTDSEGTLRRRSLTRFFPEILPIELARYPPVPLLHKEALRAGLHFVSQEEATGHVVLDDEFLTRLEAKCSSAMRLMDPDAHAAGMARVREAGARGEHWLSCYDVLLYARLGADATA